MEEYEVQEKEKKGGTNGHMYFASPGLYFGSGNLGPESQVSEKRMTQMTLKKSTESPNTH